MFSDAIIHGDHSNARQPGSDVSLAEKTNCVSKTTARDPFDQAGEPEISMSPTKITSVRFSDKESQDLDVVKTFKLKHPKNLIISHYNINSIRHKFIEISPMLHNQYFDILGIAESKIDENFNDSVFAVPHYKLHSQDRNDRGGGIMLYVDDLIHTEFGVMYLKVLIILSLNCP